MLKVMMMMMMLWQLVSLVLTDHSFSPMDDEKTPAGKYLVMTNNNFLLLRRDNHVCLRCVRCRLDQLGVFEKFHLLSRV